VLSMRMGETFCESAGIASALWPSSIGADTGEEGGCERMVISTCCSRGGDAVVRVDDSVSVERARTLLLPLSRRGRLRVKLGLASSTGSRRGGDVVLADSSAAAVCAAWSSRTFIVAVALEVVCSKRGGWAQQRVQGKQVKPEWASSSQYRQQLLQP
jgi:hypothetical protein